MSRHLRDRHATLPGASAPLHPRREPADGGIPPVGTLPEGGGGRPLPVGDGSLPLGGRHPLHPGPLRRRGDPRRGGIAGVREVSGADDETVNT